MDAAYSALWESKPVVLPVPVTIVIVDDSPEDADRMALILHARPGTSCEVLILEGDNLETEVSRADIYLLNFQAGKGKSLATAGEKIAQAACRKGALIGSITPFPVRTERGFEKLRWFRAKSRLEEDFEALQDFLGFMNILFLRYKEDVEQARRG